MLLPPTNVTAPEVIELLTPAVLPDVPITMALCTVPLFAAEMVMLFAPVVRVMLFPATSITLFVVPFRVKVAPPPPPLAPMIVTFGLVDA